MKYFLLLLFCYPAALFSQPVANFTVSVDNGCSPLVVSFTDLSTGSPTAWFWDFGNGNTSTLQNPGATYITPGTYTVTLTVTNADGSNTITQSNLITVYQNPSPAFGFDVNSGCIPLTINFTDESSPGSGILNSWTWDFGDGSIGIDEDVSHTYSDVGNYSITLLVSNEFGCENNIIATNLVSVTPMPIAGFTADILMSCVAPLTVNFTNTSVGTGLMNYLWDFGDSTNSSASNPSHTYTSNGTYNVQLIATDANGCSDTLTYSSLININPFVVNFDINYLSECAPVVANFTNLTSPVPASVFWDFGDGITSTLNNPSHTYTTAGVYDVTLTVSDASGCNETYILTDAVTVLPNYSIDFNFIVAGACAPPYSVDFNSIVPAGTSSYFWSFGDGTTSNLANPTHIYTSDGIFTVTLTASNGICSDAYTIPGAVNTNGVQAAVVADSIRGCVPLLVAFEDASFSTVPITSWFWNFGDGATATSSDPTHNYTMPGDYDVTLIVEDANGCIDTLVLNDYVQAGNLPIIEFYADPLDTCVNSELHYFELATNDSQWYWMFGDGGTSTLDNPAHTYSDTGYYDITLIVINNGCRDTLIKEDYIHISGPVVSMTIDQDCSNPLLVTITDTAAYPHLWEWDFGDGSIYDEAHPPPHLYTDFGTYTIALTVTDTITGCINDVSASVIIPEPIANFTYDLPASCPPIAINFTDLSNDAVAWNWNFGDGVFSSLQNPTHTYTSTGSYPVTLIITDQIGCTDTFQLSSNIEILGVVADIYAFPTQGCPPMAVQFVDSTLSGFGPIVSWLWDFGDGSTSTEANPTHIYITEGIYDVTLSVTDINGCSGTNSINNLISLDYPIANFIADTTLCAYQDFILNNLSSGYSLEYSWDFGDGFTSEIIHPVHHYDTSGVYTVQLIAYDSTFCADTISQTIYVQEPIAGFIADNTSVPCPPLLVSFNNTSSSDVTSWEWSFGDATSSILESPEHLYVSSGVYDLQLIVTSSFGCRDTLLYDDYINIGPRGSFTFDIDSGCIPLTVTFNAEAVNTMNYIWDFGDGNIVTSDDSIVHTYTTIGQFFPQLILENSGCLFSIPPFDDIQTSTIITDLGISGSPGCESAVYNFTDSTISSHPLLSWLWEFGDGILDTNANPSHTYTTYGTHDVTLTTTNEFGCTDSATLNNSVTIWSLPSASFIADDSSGCTPLIINFENTSTTPFSPIIYYEWSMGDGTSYTSPNITHTYLQPDTNFIINMIVSTGVGCNDTAILNISTIQPPLAESGPDDFICYDESIELNATGGTYYQWTPSSSLDDPNSPRPIASPTTTTIYTVAVTVDDCPYTSYSSIIINVNQELYLDIGSDHSILWGDSVQLFPISNATGPIYSWSEEIGLNCYNCENPYARPLETTTYILTITDTWGCTVSDTITINVLIACRNEYLYLPNAFSPNSDGLNDLLYVRGHSIVSVIYFKIFDRWGNLLFEQQDFEVNDKSKSWDGNYNGQPLTPQVVVYIVSARCPDGNILDKKGNITILK